MSSKIFTAVLKQAFKELDYSKKGIAIDGERLNNLLFEDDIVRLVDLLAEIKTMLTELSATCEGVGLQTNMSKTN